MNPNPPPAGELLAFPAGEAALRGELLRLFDDWETAIATALPPHQAHLADHFVRDGFYPHYFSQPLRILFIGRESLGISGCDYLQVLLEAYRRDKRVGEQHININRFHSRLLYIAYGLTHGQLPWDDIPMANLIGDDFALPAGLSFAFMNLSKFSNESTTSWQMDTALMAAAISASTAGPRNFIQEQIALLRPHIIITMNLDLHLAHLGHREGEIRSADINRSLLTSHGHRSILLDAWHFSSGKDPIRHIYLPICQAVTAATQDGWLQQ